MSHPIFSWKKCSRCKQYFDIGTNYDECPKCRRRWISESKKLNKKEGENGQQRIC